MHAHRTSVDPLAIILTRNLFPTNEKCVAARAQISMYQPNAWAKKNKNKFGWRTVWHAVFTTLLRLKQQQQQNRKKIFSFCFHPNTDNVCFTIIDTGWLVDRLHFVVRIYWRYITTSSASASDRKPNIWFYFLFSPVISLSNTRCFFIYFFSRALNT